MPRSPANLDKMYIDILIWKKLVKVAKNVTYSYWTFNKVTRESPEGTNADQVNSYVIHNDADGGLCLSLWGQAEHLKCEFGVRKCGNLSELAKVCQNLLATVRN